MTQELLPCPFCAGKAQIVRRDVEPQGDPYYGKKEEQFPECTICGCVLFEGDFHEGFWEDDYKNPKRAIEAWNRRDLYDADATPSGQPASGEGVDLEALDLLESIVSRCQSNQTSANDDGYPSDIWDRMKSLIKGVRNLLSTRADNAALTPILEKESGL